MTTFESNLAASGATTVPKRLRDRLHASLGGRLVWTLLADGVTLQATLRYAAVPRQLPKAERQTACAQLDEE